MEQKRFLEHLINATFDARLIARKYCLEYLPTASIYKVFPNQSFDQHPLKSGEFIFSEDRKKFGAAELESCSASEVVELLWREAKVPEWVNVSVCDIRGDHCVYELRCCGRFSSDESLLYHKHEGFPPFHSLSPPLNSGDKAGQKIPLLSQRRCESVADVAGLEELAESVISLQLCGKNLGMPELEALPKLKKLRCLEILGIRWFEFEGLKLDRFPSLESLRIDFRDSCLSLNGLPRSQTLKRLSLTGNPGPEHEFSTISSRLPSLREIEIESDDILGFRGTFPEGLESLSLRSKRIEGSPIPAQVDCLRLQLSAAVPSEFEKLLESVKRINHLDLCGSSITDKVAIDLVESLELKTINLCRTAVSNDVLKSLAKQNRKLRISPKYLSQIDEETLESVMGLLDDLF